MFKVDAHDLNHELPKELVDQYIQWGLHAISAPFAWRYTKGKGVKVAVLDTGIESDHPDLADNVKGTANFTDSPRGPYDVEGHGTHVSGIIAGTDNGEGVIGVAPQVEIYSAKVLGDNGTGTIRGIVDGIHWAVDQKVDIINMSLGTGVEPPDMLHKAIQYATKKGVIIVGATGNEDGEVCWPARYPEVLAVSAIGERWHRADFSNYGIENEIIAPGVDVTSTHINHKYAKLSGTSMATPMVVGAIALFIAYVRKYGDPETLTIPYIRDCIVESLFDLEDSEDGRSDKYGKGLLDLRTLLMNQKR